MRWYELESILQINTIQRGECLLLASDLSPKHDWRSTSVASGPPSSPPTEAPSTVSVSSSKPGLSAASIGVGAGTAVDCWGKPTSKLHVSTRCPPRSWRRDCPAPSFSHVFFSSTHLVGRHLHQGNQPLSCRKLNFPDRLVLLQPLHCAPSHRCWSRPPPHRLSSGQPGNFHIQSVYSSVLRSFPGPAASGIVCSQPMEHFDDSDSIAEHRWAAHRDTS